MGGHSRHWRAYIEGDITKPKAHLPRGLVMEDSLNSTMCSGRNRIVAQEAYLTRTGKDFIYKTGCS